MLSRITADSTFWMNRYMERSGMLRMLHTHYMLSLDKEVLMAPTTGPQPCRSLPIAERKTSTAMASSTSQVLPAPCYWTLGDINSLKVMRARGTWNARYAGSYYQRSVGNRVNLVYHLINNQNRKKITSDEEPYRPLIMLVPRVFNVFRRNRYHHHAARYELEFMNCGKYGERCLLTGELTNKTTTKPLITAIWRQEQRDILYWRGLLSLLSGYELHPEELSRHRLWLWY